MNVTDKPTSLVREIEIDAPATKVFAALIEPQQILRWWGGGGGHHAERAESDPRPGGRWLTSGHDEDGDPFTITGTYREVVSPTLLSFSWEPTINRPNDPETLVRIELTERDGVTHLRLTHSGFATVEAHDVHARGWTAVLGWLAAFAAA